MNTGIIAIIAGLAGLVSILLSAMSVRKIIPIRSELITWINAIPNEGYIVVIRKAEGGFI